MYKKPILVILLLIFSITFSYSQETESVLSSPENWKSEIIHFPMGFARSIDFVGFEDLRFAPTWSTATSDEFWTYCFVWYIEKEAPMTDKKLTESFNYYYDGLMGVDDSHKDNTTTKPLDRTLSLFMKTEEGFSGKIRVFDRFFSKEYMVLNVKVTETFCPQRNKQIVLCDLSPQPFDHKVWKLFEEVKVIVECE